MTAKFDSEWDGATPEVDRPEDDAEEEAYGTAQDGCGETGPSAGSSPDEPASDPRRRLSDEEIEHYRKELDDDLRLTRQDGSVDLTAFKTKTFMESATRGKWLSYLYKEKEVLATLKEKREEFERKVSEKIRSGTGSGFEKQKKITEFMEQSGAMKKLRDASAMQQRKIDFLTEANDIMSKFGYTIRNGLDFLKLQFS